MDTSTVLPDWIQKLKEQGKTDEEIRQLTEGVAKFSAFDVYTMIMSKLTEEDMKTIEAIANEEEAKKKMEELFTLRTGMSVDDVVKEAQEGFVRGYLAGGEEKKGQKATG